MTETWLYAEGDEAHITEQTSDSYQFHSFLRLGRRGGGIVAVAKHSLRSLSTERLAYDIFEAVETKFRS